MLRRPWVLLCAGLLGGCWCPIWGQLASTTSLLGNITDASGAALVGATVTAVNQGTNDRYVVTSGQDGSFVIQFVAPGTYSVSAQSSGFSTVTKQGVEVGTNQAIRVDFTLEVGTVSQNVLVTAEPPPIATDDASVKENLTTRTITDLPLNGRDPLRLAITTPGVILGQKATNGTPPGEDFIGPGTREIQNSVTLDGISIMNNLISTTAYHPSPDAIQELEVQTGTYTAQYGAYLGTHLNLVSKSGTNDLHGAVFEFFGNDKLNARDFFANPTAAKPPLRQNQFGFQLGGPVWIPKLYDGRNKTFFMADYEGLRLVRQSSGLGRTLTAQERTGDFSDLPIHLTIPGASNNVIPASQLSPQALKAIAYLPLPNSSGNNNVAAQFPNNDSYNQTIDRIDQNIGERARFFFRYAWENEAFLVGATNPFNATTTPVSTRNWVVAYTQTLTPNMVNDFRVGREYLTTNSLNYWYVNNLKSAGTDLGIPGFNADTLFDNPGVPTFTLTPLLGIGNGATNWFQTDTTWQGTDSFTYTHGSHTIIAGAELRKMITGREAVNSAQGQFTFSGQFTGFSGADLLLGFPSQVITPAPEVKNIAAEWRDGFFVTDSWRVSRKLTANIGLRYELPTVPYTKNGYATILNPQQTALIPANPPVPGFKLINPNHKNFAPRFGLAYRVTDQTVLRVGYGIYYNPNQTNSFTFLSANPPFALVTTYNSAATTPTLSLSNPTPASSARGPALSNIISPNPDLPTAYMNQWSFDLQQGLWRGGALDAQYLGSHSLHLDRSYFSNRPYFPGPGAIQARRPNQNFADIRIIQNDEIANHQGVSFTLRQRLVHGLSGLASYTWAHDLDVTTDSNGGGAPMNPYNWRADYGNANWDIRHRFIGSFNYELPFFKNNSHAFVRQAFGGWQTNGILTLQGGFPINVTLPNDQSNTGNSNQRPNIIGPLSANCGAGHVTNCITITGFGLPAPFTYGNAGRNILRGPGLHTLDFSLFKSFTFKERASLQFRGELFNAFNTPQFSNPSATLPTPPTGVFTYSQANAGTFGSITSTSAANRQIQFGLKLLF